MILNNNSLHLINNGKETNKCRHISSEISKRSLLSEISTLPGLYEPREDIMLDSGQVLEFYGIRKGTDVDILFLFVSLPLLIRCRELLFRIILAKVTASWGVPGI
jgi:hypothetical protein